MSTEISNLLASVEQSNRAEREKLMDQVVNLEDKVANLESAVIQSASYVYGSDKKYDGHYFASQAGPAWMKLYECHKVVLDAQRTLADLDGVEALLEKVVTAPKQAANEILNRLRVHLGTLPELTVKVTQVGLDALDAWISMFTPEMLAEARADIKATLAHTHTKPLTILTANVGAYNE